MKILIADDDPLSVRLMRVFCEGLGHACETAVDGEAAWRAYVANGADAVISDQRMPGLTGTELCKRVRAHGGPRVRFYLLSGDEDTAEAQAAGVDACVFKPVDLARLEALLAPAEPLRASRTLDRDDTTKR